MERLQVKEAEIELLINKATDMLTRSRMACSASASSQRAAFRTSRTAWVRTRDEPKLQPLRERVASLLAPAALAHRPAARIVDVADFDRCAAHVIADRRDVDSHMLKALVQACPEASVAKDNRG